MALSTDTKLDIRNIKNLRAYKVLSNENDEIIYDPEEIKLSGVTSIGIDTNQETDDVYADGVKWVSVSGAISAKVTVEVFKLSDDALKRLFDLKTEGDDTLVITGKARPEHALAFTGTDAEGNYTGYVLPKGMFDHIPYNFKTASDKPEVGDGDKLEGTFGEVSLNEGFLYKINLGKFDNNQLAVEAFETKIGTILNFNGVPLD